MICLKCKCAEAAYETAMETVDELWQMAHDLYARARSSIDPSTRRMLMQTADDYLKEANEIRRSQIIKAEFPEHERRFG